MTTTQANDYKNFLDLLAVFAEATNRLEVLQAEVQSQVIEIVDERRTTYAEAQAAVAKAEAALEEIANAHPEWFPENRRSIKTPYGTVSFRRSTKLEIANEEASIILVEAAHREDPEKLATLVTTEKRLNLEALEKLSDAELRPLRIKRVQDDNFSVKPAKLDLGKAVKEAAKKEAA